MIYLASPYSHPKAHIRAYRYEEAADCVAQASARGLIIFSPIVYGHHLAKAHALPTDAAWWKEFNETILLTCSDLWVLKVPGWRESVGVQMEIEFAKANGIEVSYIEA